MPIRKSDYPKDWPAISKLVRQAAGDRCELCSAPNGAMVNRINGAEYPWYKVENLGDGYDYPKLTKIILNGAMVNRINGAEYPWYKVENLGDGYDYPKLTKIILTVHHIDSNKRNNSKHNLIALCQRCHLRLDREKHIRNRKARRGGYQEKLEL